MVVCYEDYDYETLEWSGEVMDFAVGDSKVPYGGRVVSTIVRTRNEHSWTSNTYSVFINPRQLFGSLRYYITPSVSKTSSLVVRCIRLVRDSLIGGSDWNRS